jgi:hypothetical protein
MRRIWAGDTSGFVAGTRHKPIPFFQMLAKDYAEDKVQKGEEANCNESRNTALFLILKSAKNRSGGRDTKFHSILAISGPSNHRNGLPGKVNGVVDDMVVIEIQ